MAPDRREAKARRRIELNMKLVLNRDALEAILREYKRVRPGTNPLDGRSLVAEILDYEFPDE